MIATKPRRPKLEPMRTHHGLGQHTYLAERTAMRTHSELLCVRIELRVPKGSEGKEWVQPVMLSADTPASIVAVPYSTWFTTVITGTSALGPGDNRFDPLTAGTLQSSFSPGHRS
ncbi:hypothetical protein PIB30_008052 [Stylosanthes scabra]|uniref:DUF985 domain-containing protein n=1 Tax=Stylosanthes scabra TaxID=79078 RepID=A0ABU6W4A6_9FABA|nr:hypothetical protein [Stylosanthes scabra]